jgi:HlyD family secretion protein
LTSVTRADIGQTLTVVGTVEPVSDASAAFGVGGKVATVSATPGAQVTAGETLGTLDTTALSESVSSAQSTLNADEAKLAEDEASQTSSGSTTPTTPSASASTTTTTTAPSGTGSSGQSTAIAADQNVLTEDEAQLGTDQQKQAADLAQAQTTCETSSSSSTQESEAACEAALETVSTDQQQVSTDESHVSKDEATLAQALAAESGGSASSPTSGDSGNTGSAPTRSGHALAATSPTGLTGNSGSGANANGSNGANGSSGTSDSPEQIATDQAAIDSAEADLTNAKESLAAATLTSPIGGTVVSVGITVGDTVSANSSTEVIVVIGTQSFQVEATLDSSQVPSVKVGQPASVAIDGVDHDIEGTVSQVGPVQSGSNGYTYPVVVALPDSVKGLFAGSTANIGIATSTVHDVVAVPTSAVQTIGSRSYVLVLDSGTLTRKMVKVGMVGDVYTQILDGLEPGQRVVLADYSEAVPSSNTNSFAGLNGGGGFFGGGGDFRRPNGGGGAGSVNIVGPGGGSFVGG